MPCPAAPAVHSQVRQAVREMRDEARAVEGAPPVPDVLALQARQLQELCGCKWAP